MKIGIQCLALETNYGGILQAFALQNVLKAMGHQPVHLINKIELKESYPRSIIKTIVYNLTGYGYGRALQRICRPFRDFIDNYITHSDDLYSKEQWDNYIENNQIDLLLAGSDQVWRMEYNKNFREQCFLNFTRYPIKKISYAASLGVSSLDKNLQELFVYYLSTFEKISVREEKSISLLNDIGLDSVLSLDPTLLLTSEEYISLLNLRMTSEKYVYCYVLDKDNHVTNTIEALSKALNLALHFTDGHDVTNLNYRDKKILSKPSVISWLEEIYGSEYIITDSYHGVLFSIIFKKPFSVKLNHSRGAERFYTILKLLNLENRIVTDSPIDYSPIDYNQVYAILNKYIDISKRYLSETIN